jgi:hypothetical protein
VSRLRADFDSEQRAAFSLHQQPFSGTTKYSVTPFLLIFAWISRFSSLGTWKLAIRILLQEVLILLGPIVVRPLVSK